MIRLCAGEQLLLFEQNAHVLSLEFASGLVA